MKIDNIRFFHGLINFGTQAGMLASGLRELNILADSYVWKDSFKRRADFVLTENLSKNRCIRWCQILIFFLSCLRKYDVFHFYYGRSILKHNIDLPFYKLLGKKVIMEYLGTDVDLWPGLNGFDWRGRPINRLKLIKRVQRQAKFTNVQLVCNPRLYEFVDNSIILPLAIDISKYEYSPRVYNHKEITFMHCPTNRTAKRTQEIEDAIDKLRNEGYVFSYKCVENVSHHQLKEEYKTADVVIDQLNSWYGTVSVEAMATGRPVVCGIYNHYKLYDNRCKALPIIPADISNIYFILKDILDGKYELEKIGREGRKFVEEYHSLKSVTEQLVDIYTNL